MNENLIGRWRDRLTGTARRKRPVAGQNGRTKLKRFTSGVLAAAMTGVLVLGDTGVVFAFDENRFFREESELSEDGVYSNSFVKNVKFENVKREGVVIGILSRESDFRSGGRAELEVHIKNETDKPITEGKLTYKAKGIYEKYAGFVPWEEDASLEVTEENYLLLKETEGGDLILEEMGEENLSLNVTEGEDSFLETTDGENLSLEMPEEENLPSEAAEEYDMPTEENEIPDTLSSDANEEDEEDDPVKELDGICIEPGEVYSASFYFDIDDTIVGSRNQNVRFMFRGKSDGRKLKEEETFFYTVNYLNMDEVLFEDGNRVETGEEVTMGIHAFVYDIDAVLKDSFQDMAETATPSDAASATPSNASPATPSDAETATPSNASLTETPGGKEDSAEEAKAEGGTKKAETEDSAEGAKAEGGTKEAETEDSAEGATAEGGTKEAESENSAADALAKDNTEKAETENSAADASADDSETAQELPGLATLSNADHADDRSGGEAVKETLSDTGVTAGEASAQQISGSSPESTEEEEDEDEAEEENEEEEDEDTYYVDLEDTSYKIEMYNAALKDFEVRKAMVSDASENMLVCSFRVSRYVAPGVYFGKIVQESKASRKTYKSSQGFALIVDGEGEITLEGSLGDARVTVEGPASAFPDADVLEVSLSEIEGEELAQIDEALQKKAAADKMEICSYKAMDIRLLADGEEMEPSENVNVIFENIELPGEEEPGAELAAETHAESEIQAEAETHAESEIQAEAETHAESEIQAEAETQAEPGTQATEAAGSQEAELRRVYHIDPALGSVTDMDVREEEDGKLTIETGHFSPYIVAKLRNARTVHYGYISSIDITETADGMEPWDGNSEAGNDDSSTNGIVRSFDTISYNIEASLSSLDGSTNYTSGTLWFEVELPMDITKGRIDLDQMQWLEDYTLTYYDAGDNELAKGTKANPINYNANTYAKGSDAGAESYSTPVVRQVLTGFYTLAGETKDEVVIPGTKSLSTGVRVLAACNGEMVTPSFKVWIGENRDNETPDGKTVENLVRSETQVSAKARYDVALVKTSQLDYRSTFDLASGQEIPSDSVSSYPDAVSGRMEGYAIRLSLYNELVGSKQGTVAEKGLRGIELPRGPITLNLTFKTEAKEGTPIETQTGYTPVLWDYKENKSGNTGTWGRNLLWNEISSTNYGCWSAPKNAIAVNDSDYNKERSCYQGGKWSLDESFRVTDASTLSGTQSDIYSFTVSGYDFDLENFEFPKQNTGSAGTSSAYMSYVGNFSAGYVQVLMQTPFNVPSVTSLYFTGTASDFAAVSLQGDEIKEETNLSNNVQKGDITLYTPGSLAKYNSFTSPGSTSYASYFLGTAYWDGPNSDASAYAGDKVAIFGCTHLGRASDNRLMAVNLLQKFDSAAFTLIDDPELIVSAEQKGNVTFLYAADPEHPEGWDSNVPGIMKRMNETKEEDLIYFADPDSLEAADYTCIGVLMEIRGASIGPDRAVQIKLPVRIGDDESLLNKTYCTVNSARAWVDEGDMNGITWLDGVYDKAAGKNILEGWTAPDLKYENNPTKGYVKTEYVNGLIKNGTHAGGHQYGMSLLILGYKSSVSMKSDRVNYDLDKGQREAVFTIHNIKTTIESANSQQGESSRTVYTDLAVTASLDEGLHFMYGSDYYYCGGEPISNEADAPTVISYSAKVNGEEQTAECHIYYEMKDGNVVFHILDAVVGAQLPDITFTTRIGEPGSVNDAKNMDTFTATATISGTADERAYSITSGNKAQTTISVTKLTATGVYKTVDKRLTELDEDIMYTIVYTNNGKSDIHNLYLYDILPAMGDGRGTKFDGTLKVKEISVDLEVPEDNAAGSKYMATLYWSADDLTQRNEIYVWSTFIATFQRYQLGTTDAGTGKYHYTNTTDPSTGQIRAIGLRVNGLAAGKKLTVTVTVAPEGNSPGDIYGNNAHTWIDLENDEAEKDYTNQLTTNTVQTTVVSRKISGKVWEDTDWDGVQDSTEMLVEGAVVHLLVKNEKGTFEPCTKNVKGEAITSCTTGTDGAYSFEKLAAGTYRVVFEKTGLESYIGATEWQVTGSDVTSATDNDGKAWTDTEDYAYRIVYSSEAEDLRLLPAAEMNPDNPYDNRIDLDLGVVKGARLRLKKMVEANDLTTNELIANEPIDSAYKFLLRVQDQGTDEMYAAAALGHEEQSGELVISDFSGDADHTGGERTFRVAEIVPMEYMLTGIEMEEKENSEPAVWEHTAGENYGILTLYPGSDVTITFTNQPDHDGYFHHTASVTNEKSFAGGNGEDFRQKDPYKERHGKDASGTGTGAGEFAALVDDRDLEKKIKKREEGDELNG